MSRKVTIKYNKTIKIFTVDKMNDWENVANFLIKKLQPAMVVALKGDLGVGKTTLTQYIAKQLGVSKRTLSPTFTLIRNYTVNNKVLNIKRLIHVDAYRIKDARELFALDLDEELLTSKSVMIVEWPERIQEWINKQKKIIRVEIEI